MNRRVFPHVLLLIAGLALAAVGLFVITDDALKSVSGVCIGVGAGAFGMALSKVAMAVMLRRHPEYERRQNIEERDERNIQIREKSKAKGFDAVWITFCITMLCFILMDVNLPAILVAVGAYVVVNAVQMYYLGKYSTEL